MNAAISEHLRTAMTLKIERAIFTLRKRSLGQGNVFYTCLLFVHREEEGLPGQPPWMQTPPLDTVNKRAVRILLEYLLYTGMLVI